MRISSFSLILTKRYPTEVPVKYPKATVNRCYKTQSLQMIFKKGILENQLYFRHELYPTKAAIQRTQLSGVKFSKFIIISYRLLKTQKHSASIDPSCSGFCFFMFKIVRCVWVKYNTLFAFCPASDSFSSENLFYAIT